MDKMEVKNRLFDKELQEAVNELEKFLFTT